MNFAPRSTTALLALAAALLSAACEEEKIVYYRPMFSGVPGAESSTPITDSRPRGALGAPSPNEEITVTEPNGKKRLTSRCGRHLMVHIYNTLKDNDEALFLEQVLSKRTQDEYYERGLDPHEAFVTLRAHFTDIKSLFDQMPMGEYTPGSYLELIGPNVQRLEVHGAPARSLTWTGFDMIFEGGNYRLRWFTGPGPKPPASDSDSDDAATPVVTGPKRE